MFLKTFKIVAKIVFFPKNPFFDVQNSENESPGASKINQKSDPILEGLKIKSEQTLPHFGSFLHLKNIQKSTVFVSEDCLENGLILKPIKKRYVFHVFQI